MKIKSAKIPPQKQLMVLLQKKKIHQIHFSLSLSLVSLIPTSQIWNGKNHLEITLHPTSAPETHRLKQTPRAPPMLKKPKTQSMSQKLGRSRLPLLADLTEPQNPAVFARLPLSSLRPAIFVQIPSHKPKSQTLQLSVWWILLNSKCYTIFIKFCFSFFLINLILSFFGFRRFCSEKLRNMQ